MTDSRCTILGLDTATPSCSTAILSDGALAGELCLSKPENHTETLLHAIHTLCDLSGTTIRDIDIFAVSTGPGSFTGLRTGISTAQGLAFALGKPCAGVSSLDVLAFQSSATQGYVCPMIDARKQQVYTCLYSAGHESGLERAGEETVVSPVEWLKNLSGQVVFIGSGAGRYRAMIDELGVPGFYIAPENAHVPRASSCAMLVWQRLQRSPNGMLSNAVPRYVRPPDAKPAADPLPPDGSPDS